MKYLSRNDLETISGRVIAAYKRLPAISDQAPERVDIDFLCQELLGLRIDYARLSLNGEKIGLTYLAPEVYQAQANEINAELAKLKDVRQEKFNSKAATMLEEVRKLKMLIFEQEEPLEAFDEKLFLEIVKSIQINKEDEMSVELLGGLRFRERI